MPSLKKHDELKPCPFCGEAEALEIVEPSWAREARKHYRWENMAGSYMVFCLGCCCQIAPNRDTPAKAIAAWNRRV